MEYGAIDNAARLARLSAADRRLAVEAIWELTRASVELKVTPNGGTVRLIGRIDRSGVEPAASPDELRTAWRAGNMVARAARRLPWHPTCLRQALAVQRMLRRRSIPCRLRLGVAGPRDPSAHAWVTVAGHPVVGGQGREQFVPVAAFG